MICWFCKVIEETPSKALKLKLYGEIDSRTQATITKVKYTLHNVVIPRCTLCRSKHVTAGISLIFSFLFLISTALLSLAAAVDKATGFGTALLIGLCLGLTIGFYLIAVALHKGIVSVPKARRIYPEVKDLLARGFKFGKGLRDNTQEVLATDIDDKSIPPSQIHSSN